MIENLEVVFDNGGGITVQGDVYAHYYDDARQAATDTHALLHGADPGDWDGNDSTARVNWTAEDAANGGYKVYSAVEVVRLTPTSGWRNIDDFANALAGLDEHYDK